MTREQREMETKAWVDQMTPERAEKPIALGSVQSFCKYVNCDAQMIWLCVKCWGVKRKITKFSCGSGRRSGSQRKPV